MKVTIEQLQQERIDLTVENIKYYSNKLKELSDSLSETLEGEHPQDALPLLINIDDVLDTMKNWTSKHVSKERKENFWNAVAKTKQREM